MGGYLWTDDEIEILKEYYEEGGYKKVQEKGVKRSMGSILGIANKLGLKSVTVWTDGELDILRTYYCEGGSALCKSNGLNRSIQSIQSKAGDMGLKYIDNWTEEEVEILRKYYMGGGSELCKEKGIERELTAIKHKANSIGIYRSYAWTDLELDILNSYYKDEGVHGCKKRGISKSIGDIRDKANSLGLEYKNSKFEWSDTDIELLKDYYHLGGAKLCKEKGLEKSEAAIKNKARRLSITIVNSNKWSDEELSILKGYYEEGGFVLCKEKGLNRSKDSIRKKAHSLGLTYTYIGNSWSEKELDLLKEYYKYGADYVKEQGVNRSIDGIKQKAREYNLKVTEVKTDRKKAKKVQKVNSWSDEELSILKEYYPQGGVTLCQEKGLERTKLAIVAKSSEVRLKVGISNRNEWSEEEYFILSAYYEEGGVKLCKEKGLTRSDGAIRSKAIELGIKRSLSKKWSEDEITLLKEYYPEGGSALCIAKGLNRTKGAISVKAKLLNIKCNVSVRPIRCNDWTVNEEDILKEYYRKGGVALCQEKGLNRTYSSIKHRAGYLGIRIDSKEVRGLIGDIWSKVDFELLEEYYPKGGSKLCIEKGLNKSEGAIRRKASNLGIEYSEYKPNVLNCWRDDELKILQKYYKIGGADLCKQKGINRSIQSIRTKAKQYFPDYVRARLNALNNHPSKWTNREFNILKKYYPKGGYKQCQLNDLDRSRGAIIAKAQELRLTVKDLKGVIDLREDTWTVEELNILNTYYPLGGVNLCKQNGLNRTSYSIKSKAIEKSIVVQDLNTLIPLYRDDLWKKDELELLEQFYPKGGVELCQEKGLKRANTSIHSKARSIGLKVDDKAYLKSKLETKWKEYELNILKEYYVEGGSVLCKEKGINRPLISINSKARNLGLKYSKSSTLNKWVEEELELLKKYYPIGGVSLCQKKGINRSDNAIKTKARRLSIKYE